MKKFEVGDSVIGTVVRVYPSYAIMLFDNDKTGLLHISELSEHFVRSFTGYVQTGNIYKVRIVEIDPDKDEMKVSLKRVGRDERHRPIPHQEIAEEDISFDGLKAHLGEWKEAYGRKDD